MYKDLRSRQPSPTETVQVSIVSLTRKPVRVHKTQLERSFSGWASYSFSVSLSEIFYFLRRGSHGMFINLSTHQFRITHHQFFFPHETEFPLRKLPPGAIAHVDLDRLIPPSVLGLGPDSLKPTITSHSSGHRH